MQFLKFSILLFSLSAQAFMGTECFDSSFDVEVAHKSFPFGLLERTITVSKKGCELTFSHNKWKYLNTKWVIDICRNPIHIKSEAGSVEVLRKLGPCTTQKNDFCKEFTKIKKIIEDDGLIFATGIKSELEMAHGKMYCSYLLINEYLDRSVVFNKGQNYDYLMHDAAVKSQANNEFTVDPSSGNADF